MYIMLYTLNLYLMCWLPIKKAANREIKTKTISIPLLSTWSYIRNLMNSRLNFISMTKTCILVIITPNLTMYQPKPSTIHIYTMYCNWRMRRTWPNPTMKNYSLLINCSRRVRPTILHNPTITILNLYFITTLTIFILFIYSSVTTTLSHT